MSKKIIKWIFILVIIALGIVIIQRNIDNKYYINGNSEDNIKRSILKLQDDKNDEINNIYIIKTIELNELLLVVYKNNFNYGVAEFEKDNHGDFKIRIVQRYNNEELHSYLSSSHIIDSQYLIIFGDGNSIEATKAEISINDNIVPIDIPKYIFVNWIDITKYKDDNSYEYGYKFYDKDGRLINKIP